MVMETTRKITVLHNFHITYPYIKYFVVLSFKSFIVKSLKFVYLILIKGILWFWQYVFFNWSYFCILFKSSAVCWKQFISKCYKPSYSIRYCKLSCWSNTPKSYLNLVPLSPNKSEKVICLLNFILLSNNSWFILASPALISQPQCPTTPFLR